jgi:branched-chain amino acid transport system substrate-binding protein
MVRTYQAKNYEETDMRLLKTLLVAGTAMLATAASAQEVLKIGQIEAQTGTLSTYGWINHQGARLAVEEINRDGGFEVGGKRYRLQLVAPDTRGNPQEALIQLKQLIEQERIRYVFGPFLSNVYNGIEPYAMQNNGKFLLMGGATSMHAQLGQPGKDFAIRTWNWDGGEGGFGSAMVAYLKQQGAKRVAMLMQNDAAGKVLVDTYTEIFKQQGIALEVELFEPGTKDFTSVLAKLARSKPDFLFPGYVDAVLHDIVRQATEINLFRRFFLVRGSLAPGMKNKDQIDDYIVYTPKYFEEAQKREPKTRAFIESYRNHYKRDFPYDVAPLCSSSCYDHVYMLVEAMKKAGTVDDVAKVRSALMGLEYQGVWNIGYRNSEAVFGFDVVHMKKGGTIKAESVDPRKR